MIQAPVPAFARLRLGFGVASLAALTGQAWAADPAWDLGHAQVQAVALGYARDVKQGLWEPEAELRIVNPDRHRRFHAQVQVEFSAAGGKPKRWQTFVSLAPRTAQHRRVQGPALPCASELEQCPGLKIRVSLPGLAKREQAWADVPKLAVQRDLAPPQGVPLFAVKVIDGDTFQLQGGQRVRVLGIDTPERKRRDGKPGAEPGYQAALDLAWERIMAGPLRLTLSAERQDAYGRWLAQVTLGDGSDLGGQMLEKGLARVYKSSQPHPKAKEYQALETEARERGLGLWATP